MPVIDDTSELAHELAELTLATRRLMLAVGTSRLDPDALRAARAQMEELTARIGEGAGERVMRSDFEGPRRAREVGAAATWPIFRYNPQAMPLEMHFDGERATARTVASALYEGPPEGVHGGYLAHLLDCLLGTLVQATGRRAVTGTLDLRYLAPTPLDVPLDLEGEIVSVAGRKITALARISHDGVRTVEATGLFIDLDTDRPAGEQS